MEADGVSTLDSHEESFKEEAAAGFSLSMIALVSAFVPTSSQPSHSHSTPLLIHYACTLTDGRRTDGYTSRLTQYPCY